MSDDEKYRLLVQWTGEYDENGAAQFQMMMISPQGEIVGVYQGRNGGVSIEGDNLLGNPNPAGGLTEDIDGDPNNGLNAVYGITQGNTSYTKYFAADGAWTDTPFTWSALSDPGYGFFIALDEPENDADGRTEIGIHPDGPSAGSEIRNDGTAGCFGLDTSVPAEGQLSDAERFYQAWYALPPELRPTEVEILSINSHLLQGIIIAEDCVDCEAIAPLITPNAATTPAASPTTTPHRP